MWTPDFYYETGSVLTLEAEATLSLPDLGPFSPRLTAVLGLVSAKEVGVVSPGYAYTYVNAGVQVTIDRIVFDLRYWGTYQQDLDDYEHAGRDVC